MGLAAAGVAFFAFLAFVPLLGAIVLAYGIVADPLMVAENIRALSSFLPASAAELIGSQLEGVVEGPDSSKGFGLLLALAISLFGARSGATALMAGLDIAYDTTETRGFVEKNALALLITGGAVLGLGIVALALTVAGLIGDALGLAASYLVLFSSGALGAVLLYRHAPDRPTATWNRTWPGAVVFAALWLLATSLFGFYVANFGNYNATYGSLGAVMVLLTWLYLSAYLLLLGAELNVQVAARRA
ncbi:YihY/virulence factor BrkB family protein [Erythrobacter litoralis]|uniref:Uncharacterized protein n=1 Tax=Erythrobacter litoralis (strain HTCC2594) TaxID=314225 RepID=Q2N6H5_ERYLH|nr:YihY/virulence factor BrkB family protein [Erythrobacter litoralis]ABC64716.1 hypothetical protein ELI_13120 [Erythrobacter litoralis HTCC2594]